jgi:hypothetical protein
MVKENKRFNFDGQQDIELVLSRIIHHIYFIKLGEVTFQNWEASFLGKPKKGIFENKRKLN